jgi:hypothetical protein
LIFSILLWAFIGTSLILIAIDLAYCLNSVDKKFFPVL